MIAGQNVPGAGWVEYLFPIYREANTYPHLLDKGLPGNPEELSAKELHRGPGRSWGPTTTAREEALAKFETLVGPAWPPPIPETWCRGVLRRVESLFFAVNCHIWGKFDPESGEVIPDRGPMVTTSRPVRLRHHPHHPEPGDAYPAAQVDAPGLCLSSGVPLLRRRHGRGLRPCLP